MSQPALATRPKPLVQTGIMSSPLQSTSSPLQTTSSSSKVPRAQSFLDFLHNGPPPPPQDWPRRDWSTTGFGVPMYAGTVASADQIGWACKNATVAIIEAGTSWDTIKDKPLAVYLAIADKVLELNDHARGARGHTGWLKEYEAWKAERTADIAKVFGWAVRDWPDVDVTLPKATEVCLGALHAGFDLCDSYQSPPTDAETLPSSFFGEFSPRPSDLSRYGMSIICGQLDFDDPDLEYKLLNKCADLEDKAVTLDSKPGPLSRLPLLPRDDRDPSVYGPATSRYPANFVWHDDP